MNTNKYIYIYSKYTAINIVIYVFNNLLLFFFNTQLTLHILSLLCVIIITDAIIIQNDYKILEIKYINLIKNTDIQNELCIIKSKLDKILDINKTKESIIDINIKQNKENNEFSKINYDLARKSLLVSRSFDKKSPKKSFDIPNINVGEVITLSIKK